MKALVRRQGLFIGMGKYYVNKKCRFVLNTNSCSSDKFGLLIITQTGCKIADAGYEH